MKRKLLIAAGCLMLFSLTACQNSKATLAESSWNSIKKADSFEGYFKEHTDDIDMEALKEEAGSSDSSLSQQFKATALLCALEYRNSLESGSISDSTYTTLSSDEKNAMYQFDYPISSSYADSFLAKVDTEGEQFWRALEDAYYPYECFLPLVAAADQLEGQTLSNLVSKIPSDSSYGSSFKSALDTWIEKNPVKTASAAEDLTSAGYYDDWSLDDWKQTYFFNYTDAYNIKTGTVDEAFTYLNYLRDSLLPSLETKFSKDDFQNVSEQTSENYYSTNLAITIEEELKLTEEGDQPDTIELEGKKTAAFYRNPHTEEFKDSPTPLRLLGDFMLELPEEEYPKSTSEADYYLVLTPAYEYGDYYQDTSGNATKIQEVYSSTSIDLYDAKTGALLRHIGNITESPSSRIFKDLSDEAAQYPELVSADILSYIYHNINTPETYIALLDNTAGLGSELQRDESIILGNWEITYHSSQIVKEFDEGMFRYTANDGCQFVRGEFTITNKGTENDTFLPMIYTVSEDPIAQVTDSKRENFYDCVNAVTNSKCLNSTSLEAGESKDGEIIFEVPDEVALGTEPLYIAVSLGKQIFYYPLN